MIHDAIVMAVTGHPCWDWDLLYVTAFDPEWHCCLCFK